MKNDRYSRQTLLPEIGPSGQRKLSKAKVVVMGCGALGTHTLGFLARAGVGQIIVVDRDIIELSNLQRQSLFDEDDLGRPKAMVAEEHLRKINSDIEITGIIADVNHTNVEKFVRGATVVLDALDNMETRFLVNDACVKNGIPWVYAGAVGVTGMVMDVLPDGPCLRCVFPQLPQPGQLPTCDTVGIVNTLPAAVASIETTEAFKIILGAQHARELLVLDLWGDDLQRIKVSRDPGCEACGKRDFEFLKARKRKLAATLCGRNAIQIVPARVRKGGLAGLEKKLSRLGRTSSVDGVLRFKTKGVDLTIFADGRTIVGGTTDLARAKTVYSRYVGD